MFQKTTNPVAVRLRQAGEDLQVEAADEIDRLQQERDEAQSKIREMVEWLHPAQWAELDRARLKLLGIALGETQQ